MKIIFIFLFIIMILFIIAFQGPAKVFTTETGNHKIVGYITGWSMSRISLEDIKLEELTYLIFSYVTVTNATNPAINFDNNENYIRQCVDASHAKGVKILVSLYGSPSGELNSIVDSDTLRSTLVNNIKDLMVNFNLDGIDIDWEALEPQSAMDKLITDLYTVLHPLKKIISIDASWYRFDISISASKYVDLINVMTYDMWKPHPFPYHSLFNDCVAAINMWVNGGYPRDKLLMGIPFYGKDNQGTVARYSDIVNALSPTPGQNKANIDSILVWDSIVNKVNGGTLWWNGENLAKQKTDWVLANNLGGIMCYELGGDILNDPRSLLQIIYDELIPPAVNNVKSSNITTREAMIYGNVINLGTANTTDLSCKKQGEY